MMKSNIDISFFTGVPDSLLKSIAGFIEEKTALEDIIAANEESAITIGVGYYLATKPLIYMQNSGLKSIKPLVS